MVDILGFFQRRRIRRTEKEIKQKEKMCELQEELNNLLREEKEIESA